MPLRILPATAKMASKVQGDLSIKLSYVSYDGSNSGIKRWHPAKKLQVQVKTEMAKEGWVNLHVKKLSSFRIRDQALSMRDVIRK